jgi:hypothetical protein
VSSAVSATLSFYTTRIEYLSHSPAVPSDLACSSIPSFHNLTSQDELRSLFTKSAFTQNWVVRVESYQNDIEHTFSTGQLAESTEIHPESLISTYKHCSPTSIINLYFKMDVK